MPTCCFTHLLLFYLADFWTTKCTRCPDALDKLDRMASDPKYENVQFISICCDKLDGARDMIEASQELRWQNVDHYFMEQTDKEKAKKQLGFKSVPFYVVLDEEGQITQKGGQKAIDFDEVPGVVRPTPMIVEEENKENVDDFGMDFALDFTNQPFKEPPAMDRVFSIEDDF